MLGHGEYAHTETMTFTKSGQFLDVWSKPSSPQHPAVWHEYAVFGDILTGGPVPGPNSLKWSYFRGQLTFTVYDPLNPLTDFSYTVNPWRKIG